MERLKDSLLQLITETARQFGYSRTGGDIKKRVSKAIDLALKEGALVVSADMLSAPS